MKRAFLFFAGLLIFSGLGSSGLRGEEPSKGRNEGSVQPPKSEIIHLFGETYLRDRINDLERRFSELERDIRFLEDQTRNLDRRLDDLRQHHV